MEDVSDFYKRPYNPARPLVCLDETSKQLVAELRCLARRIVDATTLKIEADAWCSRGNTHNAKANWHFTTADARVKLKSLYPEL